MKPRILYVTHRVPFPPDRGDRIRTWNVLKFLANYAEVDLACLAEDHVEDETWRALRSVTRRLEIIPHRGPFRYFRGAISLLAGNTATEGLFHNTSLQCTVRSWNAKTRYRAVMASSSGVARFVLPPIVRRAEHTWIDLIDVDSQKWLDYGKSASLPMSLVYGLEGRRLRQLETRIAHEVDRLLVVSDAEKQLFESFCPDGPIQAIGNGVDTEYFTPLHSSPRSHSCVFVGVMDYLPNVDAVCWFADRVWPGIRERYPDAQFQVVGKSPTSEVLSLQERPGIHVTGSVADVRPWLHNAGCVVVPLRIARGVQNKVLEAMACGCPVICSPAPLKGLRVEPGLHLLQAETSEGWIDQVTRVFESPELANELSAAANAWVSINHRWEACLDPLLELTDGSPDPSAPRIGANP